MAANKERFFSRCNTTFEHFVILSARNGPPPVGISVKSL